MALPKYNEYFLEKVIPNGNFLFASESVGEGHPDKLCDIISDAVVDACIAIDPKARVACETAAKGETIINLGEISVKGIIDFDKIVRNVLKEVGYENSVTGVDYKTCKTLQVIEQQSNEIAIAVVIDKEEKDLGAGDQGLMFGYATDEWDNEILFPLSHHLANKLCERLAECRKKKIIPWLGPDCKSQITCEYKKENEMIIPFRVHNVTISTQHDKDVPLETIRKEVLEKVIKEVIPAKYLDEKTIYYINPSSSFVVGGPKADAGLTGRKIIVDTYGGWAPHGGGAFSGKDPTKVDRSAAYYCRYVAKNLIYHGLCRRALVQVSYAIGRKDPLSLYVHTYGTAKNGLTDRDIENIVKKNFDFRPGCMIQELNLRRPIYQKTASYCHFGRMDPDFTWEQKKLDFKL